MAVDTAIHTLADLHRRLGGVPLDRIRFRPPPGTATVADVLRLVEKDGIICELVDGVLVEKVMGFGEAQLAAYLLTMLNNVVLAHNLGLVVGPDGTIELAADLVRIPDIAFFAWDHLPGRRRPPQPVPQLAPTLAVEVLSPGNTAGEMAVKRADYFTAGVELVWEVDPDLRAVTVYTAPDVSYTLRGPDVLDGGAVLPGFALPLPELFGELDRQG